MKYILKPNFVYFNDQNDHFAVEFSTYEEAREYLDNIEDNYFIDLLEVNGSQSSYYTFLNNRKDLQTLKENEDLAVFDIFEVHEDKAIPVHSDDRYFLIKSDLFK